MIFNYLKLSLRLLVRNPFFTFINVVGLSVGFAVFIILWQYSQNELRSDRFHKDYERIARLVTRIEFPWKNELQVMNIGFDTPIHSVKMAESIPQIEAFTRILNQHNFNKTWIQDHSHQIFFSVSNKGNREDHFFENQVAYADPNVFDFFGIPLISGNQQKALSHPNNVVLSARTARKYFGDEDPLNKVILLNNSIPVTVSGVFADLPNNTHLEFEIVLSMLRLEKSIQEFKLSAKGAPVSYFKMRNGVAFEALTPALLEDSKRLTEETKQKTSESHTARTFLQPLQDVPFFNYEGDHFVAKSKQFLVILNTIAFLILIIAWINYISLTLSANIKRQKELAARKTVGARPIDFIKQFLLEAAIVNVLSLAVALTIIQITKNALAVFFDFHIYETYNSSFHTWGIVFFVLILGILVTGIYPALSTLRITSPGLFGKGAGNNKEITVSNALIVIQYTSAIVLIIGVFSVYRQLSYILSRNIGIKRDDIVVIDLPVKQSETFRSSLNSFCTEISGISSVENFTVSNNVVGDLEENNFFVKLHSTGDGFVPDSNGGVDENFLPFYGIQLLAGRNFLPNHPADTSSVLISLQGIKNLGVQHAEDIIGKTVLIEEADFSKKYIPAEVIGVFADYKRNTFFSAAQSSRKGDETGIALTYGDYIVPARAPRKVSVRISPENFESGLASVKEKYDKLFPGNAFNWYFLDQNINRYYVNEKIALNQIILFAGLVVGIACLGLLGMITQKVIQKTKEIGVRKVLGARLHHIGSVLLTSTIRQIIIAVLIGIPVAWYLIQQYLERFSVRITLQWWHYAIPVALLLFIMFVTIASILIKAARTNPVESLRYE